ncbi:MAG: NAD(P)/FAD-dependent oxidoreductase [Chloroflexi bacterium]|nr:NAD(P)/FAD-dependent oxidoreductase [Chloroflexota bacterium]MCC6894772.1 NAD(P)/FAD-dependent oxidoreductase [Anaerolineae bacterium]
MDVIIIGGGVSGLSAAMYLGRFRRQVLVVDGGKPANRFTHASHSFFTRDGIAPGELLAIGREQLAKYDTVELKNGEVTSIVEDAGRFTVTLADGSQYQTGKVLLATGLKDGLPAIAGIEPLWGKSVFSCPFCDGWEHRDQPVVIVANAEAAFHVAKLLRVLTADLVICTNEPAEFDAEQAAKLKEHGIRVIETPIARFDAEGEQLTQIVFKDGSVLPRTTAFIRTWLMQPNSLAELLGCETDEHDMITIDSGGRTSVKGVYAAGDLTGQARQVVNATHQGAWAGIAINNDLIAEQW